MAEHAEHDAHNGGPRLTRRRLLTYAGAGAGVLVLGRTGQVLTAGSGDAGVLIRAAPIAIRNGTGFTARVVRPSDMLVLDFQFVNLEVVASAQGPQLRRFLPGDAYIVVTLPAQTVREEATPEGFAPPFAGDVRSVPAAPTQLAFLFPPTATQIPYTLDRLLNWASFGRRGSTIAFGQPLNRIEAPWGLVLDPDPQAFWLHATQPVTRGTRTEVWRTASTRFGPGFSVLPSEVRFLDANRPDPFVSSLTAGNRGALAGNTDAAVANSAPVTANRLQLSALGANLVLDGSWPLRGLSGYRHRATLGRDQFVQVVETGYLFPLGHRAAQVTIAERKFRDGGAYLLTRRFIVVERPVKDYPAPFEPFGGRLWPFRQVRVVPTVTPDLSANASFSGIDPFLAFWPQVNGADFVWTVEATDLEGRKVGFRTPLAFVFRSRSALPPFENYAHSVGTLTLEFAYPSQPESRRRVDTGGQTFAFAPPGRPGDTALSTSSFVLGAEAIIGPDVNALLLADQPNFWPTIVTAQCRVPAVEALVGISGPPPEVRFDDAYRDAGFDPVANRGSVFLGLPGAPKLDIPAEQAGGVASPSSSLTALSRQFGPVGGAINDLRTGVFDPRTFFDDQAKFLGSLLLREVIDQVSDVTGAPDRVPKLLTQKFPDRLETRLDWKPQLKAFGPFEPLPNATCELVSVIVAQGTSVRTSLTGDVRNVAFKILPGQPQEKTAITLVFSRIRFASENGAKPDLDIDIADVLFGGPLTFVNDLRNFLKNPGNGLSIDISPQGIDAGYTLALPNISVGIFALQNIAISAGVVLPFDDRPIAARFAFCSREKPFLLTYSLFAGGGFVGIRVSSAGLEVVEVALEFGAAVSLNLGVASGSVSVMAGIYFKIEQKPTGNDVTLSGYVRLNGSVEVLGIITISVEFYLSLTYQSATKKVIGRASVKVKVEVLFFSVSVSLTVERKFGGGGDPPFGVAVSAGDWSQYCDAFAVEA